MNSGGMRMPFVYRLLGYRLDKPGRGPACAYCLAFAVICVPFGLAALRALTPRTVAGLLVCVGVAAIVGTILDSTMRRHLPLLPCPGCGEKPKQFETDWVWRVLCGYGSVGCGNGCDVIPESPDRFEWNALCLQFARLVTENKCPACRRRIAVTREPDTGRVVSVECQCHVVNNSQPGRSLLMMLVALHNLVILDRRKAELEERHLNGISGICARNGFKLRDGSSTTSNHQQIREEPCVKTTD